MLGLSRFRSASSARFECDSAFPLMHSKIAISACRLVSHDRRQISSALMVLKGVDDVTAPRRH
jgi:hypothetical protein